MGIGLNYIEKNIGEKNFNKYLKEYISKSDIKSFEDFFLKKTDYKTEWFLKHTLKTEKLMILKSKKLN